MMCFKMTANEHLGLLFTNTVHEELSVTTLKSLKHETTFLVLVAINSRCTSALGDHVNNTQL